MKFKPEDFNLHCTCCYLAAEEANKKLQGWLESGELLEKALLYRESKILNGEENE